MRRAAPPMDVRVVTAFLGAALLPALSGCTATGPMAASSGKSGSILASRQAGDVPPAPASPIVVTLHALRDTVVAHQTAWVEVRITNNGPGGLDIPDRGQHLVADWRFEDTDGRVRHDWQAADELARMPILRLGPGETLYEVIALESSFGILTDPGSIRAWCRVKDEVSMPIQLSRVVAPPTTPPSVLRDAGPLLGEKARETIQVKLWSACAGDGDAWFDCDEALYTVAWDRMQGAPDEAEAIVDTLIARHADSGWCRPAIHDLLSRLPEAAGRRWLEGVIARAPGGVAENYAREMMRRTGYGQFPAAR
ncbi:MAG TPA: hypothetical protein VF720_07485 [Candidatus Eisenbacteria bacterium]